MELNKVTIIGGGVLGTQIGLMCAYVGKDVTFWLRSEESVERTKPKLKRYSELMLRDLLDAKALIGSPMGKFAYPRGLIRDWNSVNADEIDALAARAEKNFSGRIRIELDLASALADADVVIEAMAEDPKAKIAIYTDMKNLLPEKAVLLTNSSTLLPSAFAEYTGRPEKYLALHFANTIWKNNTAEVMGHPGTDPEIYKETVKFADEMNMIPLQLHKEQPGYILNSMLVPFLTAAQALLATGVSDHETIDRTWELATGAPAGPFKILDIVGLETAYNINQMKPEAHEEGSVSNLIGKLLKEKIDKGETGVNAGVGFYQYK
ncbi:MAG: 3-hydroxyacyl-CoA dehydrogenase [Oscillospiraceae bacterium]|nr:3-hydroxyacyl-CoA dehydrogenase [Oscillospiraceae bacterium]